MKQYPEDFLPLTTDFLADCGRRALGVIRRGVPRRQFDNLAAECGMVIGQLCQTTEQAQRLTDALVSSPLPRWEFREFEQRALKLAKATQRETLAEAQSHSEHEWTEKQKRAAELFTRLAANYQTKRREAKRAELERRLAKDPEAWLDSPAGANFRLRNFFTLHPEIQEAILNWLCAADILEDGRL